MSTLPMSVPLATLSSTSASPASAPLTSSSLAAVSKLAGTPTAGTATPFSTFTSNSTQSACSLAAGTSTLPACHQRRESKSIRRWLNCVGTIILGLLGVFAAYIALSLALWTSMKDYREDCRTQKSTNNVLSKDCEAALKSPLSPPPFSSSHIREKRLLQDDWSQSHNSHLSSLPKSIKPPPDAVMATAIMVAILSLVVLVFVGLDQAVGQTEDRPFRPIGLRLSHRMLDSAHEIIPAAWIATSVARRAPHISQGEDDNTGMRERKATKELHRDDDSEHWGTVEMVYSNKYNRRGWNARAYASIDDFSADSDGETSWPITAETTHAETIFSETDTQDETNVSPFLPSVTRSVDDMDGDLSDASTSGIHMGRLGRRGRTLHQQDALSAPRRVRIRHTVGDILRDGYQEADALPPSSDAETQRAVIEEQFPEVSGSVAPHQRKNLVDATPTTPWFKTRPFLGDRVLLADPFYAKRPPSTPKVAPKRQKEHSPSKQVQKAANNMDQKITFWSKTKAAMQGGGRTDNITNGHLESSSTSIVQRESVEHRTSALQLQRDAGSTEGNWLKRRSRRFLRDRTRQGI